MRYIVPILLLTGGLIAFDFYVYRRWRRFAADRRSLRWTLPVYRVLLWVMPASLPLYLNLYSWWEVEPRLARAAFFAFWAVYYVPKLPVVLVLLAADAARYVEAAARYAADAARYAGTAARYARVAARYVRRGVQKKPSEPTTQRTTRPEFESVRKAESRSITRADFLRQIGWSAAAIPFVVTGYGVFRTLYDFSVHRVDVPVAGLPRAFEGMTIAQLSDLHAGSLFSDRPMWDAVSIVNGLRPDVVALTGDFVNHDAEEMVQVLPALKALTSGLGVFGCLGNHDHYADTARLVGQIGTTPIELLVNAHRTLTIDGAQLHVIGTDNTGFRQHFADLPRAVAGIEPGGESARILLAHDPTYWDSHVRRDHEDIDLMLCGHTHGGQFGVEIGPLRWSLAQVRYERWAGLYAEPRSGGSGPQFLYVNRGIGTVGPPLRLGIRPEVTLLTLRRG